jgi:hypothetical protein
MTSVFLYLSAAAAAQISTSALSSSSAPRQPHDVAHPTTREWLQNRNLLLIAASGTPRLAAPLLYALLLFFPALLVGYLITDGLYANTYPVRRHGQVHAHRSIHHEKAFGAIGSPKSSQEGSVQPSSVNTDHFAAPAKRPAKPGLHYSAVVQFDGPSVRIPQRGMLPCDYVGPGEPHTPSARGQLGDRVLDSIEAFQPHRKDDISPSRREPTPQTETSAASQRSRKLNWFSLLAFATLLIVLSGLLEMVNATDVGSVLGDSTISLIPLDNSSSGSLTIAITDSTSSSPRPTSTKTTTFTNSEALISMTMTVSSVPTAVTKNIPSNPTSIAPNMSLAPGSNSGYTTIIPTTIIGLLPVKDGASNATTERYFVISRTTVITSNSSLVVGNLSTSTSSTIASVPSTTTKTTNTSSSAMSSLPTTNAITSFAISYVVGNATISSFIPAPAGDRSPTILPIPGNATLGPSSQPPIPLFSNQTTSSVTATMYTTVTSTRSFMITSTIMANVSRLQFALTTRSMSLAPSLTLNTDSTIINGTILTGSPTNLQSSTSAASASQSSVSVSLPSPTSVTRASRPGNYALSWTTLLTMETITNNNMASGIAVGGSNLASPAAVQTTSVTTVTVVEGYFTSASLAAASPMSLGSLSTSTASAISQPQVSPQALLANMSLISPSQPLVSPPSLVLGENSITLSAPTTSIYDKREASPPISTIHITVLKTTTPVVTYYIHSRMYNPWIDDKSKFRGYTDVTCSQDQYIFRSCHSEKPSHDPLSMEYDCILPISSITQTPQIPVHYDHDEVSRPHEVRDGNIVLTVTVTSYVDETYPSTGSPGDSSDHLTALFTSVEPNPTPASLLGFGFDELEIDPRNDRVTTGLGFTPTISLEPRPTAVPGWFTVDGKTIPPPPGFKTYHPSSSAVPTVSQDNKWSANPFAESQAPYWTSARSESDTTTSAPNATAVVLSSLTANFTPPSDHATAAAAKALLNYQSSRVSSEMASWEADQIASAFFHAIAPSAPTPAPRQPPPPPGTSATAKAVTTVPSSAITLTSYGTLAPKDNSISHGSSFATLSKKEAKRAITCASPLTPVALSTASGSQARPEAKGVCPSDWMTISSGGEKRIKAWYAAGAMDGYVVAALVIGLVVLGGAVVRAVEDVREVVDGVGVGVW